jgi:hypothetical protein
MMNCSTNQPNHQPFPSKGALAKNINLSYEQLSQQLPGEETTIYLYIIDTIKNWDGNFVQTGSAPNFQGDLITLCTCKHRMRTFREVNDWPGIWIAGFTGVEAGRQRNALVYLMKVAHAFESHHDLWFSTAISERTKQAKLAHLSRFGDVFQPNIEFGCWSDPQSYMLPHSNHSHIEKDQWHKDINYIGCSGRRAALLVGDVKHSYLWNRPLIFYPFRLHRGQKKSELGELLHQLEEQIAL